MGVYIPIAVVSQPWIFLFFFSRVIWVGLGGSFASCLHSISNPYHIWLVYHSSIPYPYPYHISISNAIPVFHDVHSQSDSAVSRNIFALLFIILFCSAWFRLGCKLTRPATKEDNKRTALTPYCTLKQLYGLRKFPISLIRFCQHS